MIFSIISHKFFIEEYNVENNNNNPEICFEDQYLALFSEANVYDKPDSDKQYDYEEDYNYNTKYRNISLWDAKFAVSPEEFKQKIFDAFISHAKYMEKQIALYPFIDGLNTITQRTMKRGYGNKEETENNLKYFKALVDAMNMVIEDPRNTFPKNIFKMIILDNADERMFSRSENYKEMINYFCENFTKTDGVKIGKLFNQEFLPTNAFINYLIILTLYKEKQDSVKNLIWDEFSITNANTSSYRLRQVMNKYNLRKIDFSVINKDILLEYVSVEYLAGMRRQLSGKSKIKDSLTEFLIPLTSVEQKKKMFLDSIFEKYLGHKYFLVEKKYFPSIVDEITDIDVINAFSRNGSKIVNFKNKFFSEDSFATKMLKEDLQKYNDMKEGYLDFMKEKVVEAFKTYKVKEQKKEIRKALTQNNNIIVKKAKVNKKRM